MAGGTSAVGILQGTGNWTSGASAVNPVDQALLVDTGQLPAASYLFGTTVNSTAQTNYVIQWRDSTNTTNNQTQTRTVQTSSNDDFLFPNKIKLAANERVRIIEVGGINGTMQASIWFMEVGGT